MLHWSGAKGTPRAQANSTSLPGAAHGSPRGGTGTAWGLDPTAVSRQEQQEMGPKTGLEMWLRETSKVHLEDRADDSYA